MNSINWPACQYAPYGLQNVCLQVLYMSWIIIQNKFRSEWCQTRLIDFSVSNYGSKSETKENHNQTGLKPFLIDSKFILNYKIYTINVALSLKGRLHK